MENLKQIRTAIKKIASKNPQRFMMYTIVKHFETIKQAEKYQNSLYNKFNSVRLFSFPSNSESGLYTWEVSQ